MTAACRGTFKKCDLKNIKDFFAAAHLPVFTAHQNLRSGMGSACSCVAGQREEAGPGAGREAAGTDAEGHSAGVRVGKEENTELLPVRAAPNGESISAEGGNPVTLSSAPELERPGSVVSGAKGGEAADVQTEMAQEGTSTVNPGPSTIVIVMGASVRRCVLACAPGNGNMRTGGGRRLWRRNMI